VGSTVRDENGALIGSVTMSSDPASVTPQTPVVDMAFVALDPGVTGSGGIAHGTGVHAARPRDDLDIFGAKTGHTSTWVRAAALTFAGPDPLSGDWGFVLITRDGVTAQGDSGAVALFSGTDEVVGHVVGGSPGVYTLVQELDYQLGLSGAPAGSGALVGVSLR
jgi:hypothetical protein